MFSTKCKKCGTRIVEGYEYCYHCEPSTIKKKQEQGKKNLDKFYSRLEKSNKIKGENKNA